MLENHISHIGLFQNVHITWPHALACYYEINVQHWCMWLNTCPFLFHCEQPGSDKALPRTRVWQTTIDPRPKYNSPSIGERKVLLSSFSSGEVMHVYCSAQCLNTTFCFYYHFCLCNGIFILSVINPRNYVFTVKTLTWYFILQQW